MADITMPHKIPAELYAPEKCPIHCNLRLNVTALCQFADEKKTERERDEESVN